MILVLEKILNGIGSKKMDNDVIWYMEIAVAVISFVIFGVLFIREATQDLNADWDGVTGKCQDGKTNREKIKRVLHNSKLL